MKEYNFGFKNVSKQEKDLMVKEVFDDVSPKYDLMNDLMSFGLHRIWKFLTCYLTDIKAGDCILDLACGTGDVAKILNKKLILAQKNSDKVPGQLILADINNNMLNTARDKLIDKNIIKNVKYVQTNAEYLPFNDHSFDLITIAFGLRNVADKPQALKEMYRVLKPGGKLYILEFSHPNIKLFNKIYEFYAFNVLPTLGKIVTGKPEHYQYLVESIKMHPKQEELKNLCLQAGFDKCIYNNFSAGIVALHRGFKY